MSDEKRLRWIMDRLLDRLRRFMHAYARNPEMKLTEHALVWLQEVGRPGGGPKHPGEVIMEAIKANPELWRHALPSDVCVVPRQMLGKLVGEDMASEMAYAGWYRVEAHATRLHQEIEDRDNR